MDGRKAEYITTDISDPAMAQALRVNLGPRLAQALAAPGRPSVVERVYKFADDTQITVFQSAPAPTGPGNADPSYSPLWRMEESGPSPRRWQRLRASLRRSAARRRQPPILYPTCAATRAAASAYQAVEVKQRRHIPSRSESSSSAT